MPVARPITQPELQAELGLEARLTARLGPSEDAGLAGRVARAKRDIAEDLFLRLAAVGCDRVPRAALALYGYAFTSPALRPELDNLAAVRTASRLSQACRPGRLAITKWQGVHATSTHATAILTGRYEIERGHGWKGDRRIWRVDARYLAGRWKIAVLAESQPDFKD